MFSPKPWCDVAPEMATVGRPVGPVGGPRGPGCRWAEPRDAVPVGPGGGAAAVAQRAAGRFSTAPPGVSVRAERRKCRTGRVDVDVSRSTTGGGENLLWIAQLGVSGKFWRVCSWIRWPRQTTRLMSSACDLKSMFRAKITLLLCQNL